jgi:acetyl esterase/lipase
MRLTVMRVIMVCAAQGVIALCAHAATNAPLPSDAALPQVLHDADTYRLWAGRAPGTKSDSPQETPTITWFAPPPGRANGTAVIIAPGGGYTHLAGILEGTQPASWFTTRGVTAFVLQYRFGAEARLPTPLFDGARAVRFVRAHAPELHIDPDRIGMMGFSAGGHLAAMTGVEAFPGQLDRADPVDQVSGRPDFLILGYPWLEGTQLLPDGHSQYCDFAIRDTHTPCEPKDYVRFAPRLYVTSKAPPTFIYHTSDDGLVPAEGSLRFYEELRKQNIPVEMHVFEHGPHGTGLGGSDPQLSTWPRLLQEWMRHRGLLPTS